MNNRKKNDVRKQAYKEEPKQEQESGRNTEYSRGRDQGSERAPRSRYFNYDEEDNKTEGSTKKKTKK